jgi:thiamine pyrophosphokinase
VTAPLVRVAEAVTLVGGGPVDALHLAAALALAPVAVAADGGGDLPLPEGRRFRAVVGDMDSLADPDRLRAAGVPIYPIPEQETTDLEKCLGSIEAPLFVGLGFLGGRIDHHLAAMNALVKFAAVPVVLVGGEDLCFLCPPEFAVDLSAGTRVSLFPMGPVRGRLSEGLLWPIAGLAFDPTGRIGTSNAATGGPVLIGLDAPRMLVILPAGLLRPVVDRLRGAPDVRWPRSR